MKLKSISIIQSANRNSTIDVFRAVAILLVVFFHYNHIIPFGNIGVDLFFVISGILVGGLIINQYKRKQEINFFRFILQRGFKIWPSYYVFILLGNVIVYYSFKKFAPDQAIPLYDLKRYLLFYKNYVGSPYHWTFDNVWSLCVEEHFYVLLPIFMIIIQRSRSNVKTLIICVAGIILVGILSKFITYYYFRKNPYFHTNDRIDALAWGVLLSIIITYKSHLIDKFNKYRLLFWAGILLLIITLIIESANSFSAFSLMYIRIILPVIFFLMIAGLYNFTIKSTVWLRFIAYYSYNWYLWHLMIAKIIGHYFPNGIFGLSLFLFSSFIVAMFFTITVEEPMLWVRKRLMQNRISLTSSTQVVAE